LIVENDHINGWLAEGGVEGCSGIAESRNVGGNVLIDSSYTAVEVWNFVVREFGVEIQIVNIASKPSPERNRELGLKVSYLMSEHPGERFTMALL
jgi:hypothetical protein